MAKYNHFCIVLKLELQHIQSAQLLMFIVQLSSVSNQLENGNTEVKSSLTSLGHILIFQGNEYL